MVLSKRHQKIVVDTLCLPTAPFSEEHVRQHVFDFCRRRGVRVREDRAGNILAHYRHASARVRRPLCLCAHLDHPGFRALRMLGPGTLKAQWLGGVPPEYFPNAKVRFFCDGAWVHGRVTQVATKTLGLERPQRMVDTVEVRLVRPKNAEISKGAPGMWDLPDPQIKGRRIHARACDDLAGVAAMLCCVDSLTRRKTAGEAYFLFTRAEEVGFIGAIAACRSKTIPSRCAVVAIETSAVLPGVEMGGGPILRVGDKSSVFSPDLTAWCGRVAAELASKDRRFRYQRKLMDGGSCESSAYYQLGYDATGICIALGNYHNCDRARKKIATEYVHLDDVGNLVKWFCALAATSRQPTSGDPQLVKRLGQLERRYQRLLKATA